MRITVYGPGCYRCHETEQVVLNVLAELDIAADVEKVSDWKTMVKAGVLATPAVAVDGQIRLSGRIPTPADVRGWLGREKTEG